MNLRCKKSRPLIREEKTYRDARLFVIATEDTHAPAQYFRLFRNPRIQVRVLPTEGGLSAPGHVIQRLDDFVEEFQMVQGDEFWLMLDTDHWVESNHITNFDQVCTQATQKGFHLCTAIRASKSGSCFM